MAKSDAEGEVLVEINQPRIVFRRHRFGTGSVPFNPTICISDAQGLLSMSHSRKLLTRVVPFVTHNPINGMAKLVEHEQASVEYGNTLDARAKRQIHFD